MVLRRNKQLHSILTVTWSDDTRMTEMYPPWYLYGEPRMYGNEKNENEVKLRWHMLGPYMVSLGCMVIEKLIKSEHLDMVNVIVSSLENQYSCLTFSSFVAGRIKIQSSNCQFFLYKQTQNLICELSTIEVNI